MQLSLTSLTVVALVLVDLTAGYFSSTTGNQDFNVQKKVDYNVAGN